MTDSIEISDIEQLPRNEKAIRDQIEKAETTYQLRKKNLEEKIEKLKILIEKANKYLENYTKTIIELNKQVHYKERELDSVKQQLNAVLDALLDCPGNETLQKRKQQLEKLKAQKEHELQDLKTKKREQEEARKDCEEQIRELENKRAKLIVLYKRLTGEGADELRRNNALLSQQADVLRSKYNLAKARPGM